MRKEYKETFDTVHASQRLKTEILNMKREEIVTKKRRVPAAALVAAVLVIALAGTALAAELYHRVRIQIVDPSEADDLGVGEFDVGYTARSELVPLPLEALSEEALERAAGVEKYDEWTFDSWSEAAEFFGLDLAESPALAKLRRANNIFSNLHDQGAYCWAAVEIDPETPGIPSWIFLQAGYVRGTCSIVESVRIWIESPGQSGSPDNADTIDAGLLVIGPGELQTETYVTPSGMEVSIVTHDVGNVIDHTAYFIRDGFYCTVSAFGNSSAMDNLKEILDAYE